MMYPPNDKCVEKIVVMLAIEPLSIPELCLNMFPRVAKKLIETFGINIQMEQLKLAKWIVELYPIEWMITCEACDTCLLYGKVQFNKDGLLEIRK